MATITHECDGRKTLYTVHEPTFFQHALDADEFIRECGDKHLKLVSCWEGYYVAITDEDTAMIDFVKKTDEKGQWIPSNIFKCNWEKVVNQDVSGHDTTIELKVLLSSFHVNTGKFYPSSFVKIKFFEKFGHFFIEKLDDFEMYVSLYKIKLVRV